MQIMAPRFSGTYRLTPAGVQKFPKAIQLMQDYLAPGGILYQQGVRAAFEDNRGNVVLIVGQTARQDELIGDALTHLTLKSNATYQKDVVDLTGKLTPW